MTDRLVFGMMVPCPKCDLSGHQAAPPMSKGERDERKRENKRRELAGAEPLPRPPRTVACARCGGRGVIPASEELASPPDGLRSGVDVQ